MPYNVHVKTFTNAFDALLPAHTEKAPVDIKSPRSFSREYIYDKYSGILFGMISRAIPDVTLSEQLLIDCFKKIYSQFPQQNNFNENFFTNILRITRLTINNHLSKTCSSTEEGEFAHKTLVTEPESENLPLLDFIYLNGLSCNKISEQYSMPLTEIKSVLRKSVLRIRQGDSN